VTIAAAKGGSCKSTCTISLAVRASDETSRVALFDLNGDQGDLTKWWKLRGEPRNPRLIEVEHISRDVEVLRNQKFDWLLIDCPLLDLDMIENSILKSDATRAETCSTQGCGEGRINAGGMDGGGGYR